MIFNLLNYLVYYCYTRHGAESIKDPLGVEGKNEW